MEQDEDISVERLKYLLVASIIAETEAIDHPSPETDAEADRLWQELGKCWKTYPDDVMREAYRQLGEEYRDAFQGHAR